MGVWPGFLGVGFRGRREKTYFLPGPHLSPFYDYRFKDTSAEPLGFLERLTIAYRHGARKPSLFRFLDVPFFYPILQISVTPPLPFSAHHLRPELDPITHWTCFFLSVLVLACPWGVIWVLVLLAKFPAQRNFLPSFFFPSPLRPFWRFHRPSAGPPNVYT